ncbi:MAG: NAD(P)H-hydrate dehydratase, partial [Chloroflexi bacterium]|nr:NAD(P)H-hydrate dehydratase [Chloroflexota bacterium]
TLGCPKLGLFRFPGAERVGRLVVVDIGIPPHLTSDGPLEMISDDWVRQALPPRPLGAHKGSFGRVLVVAGSRNYIGAAYLACTGAGRVGTGLVTLATLASLLPVVASKLTEATYLPLPESIPGIFTPEAARLLRQAAPGYDAVLVGCGLGQDPAAEALVRNAILAEAAPNTPMVLDADALNLLARIPDWWEQVKGPAVLTPHPAELSRLLGRSVRDIEENRLGVAREAAEAWGVVVVLKGAFTVVASPQGRARISPFANPGLATAGTGDVLAGAIAGLQAQGMVPFDAACAGVFLHGAAGELVRQELGDTGTLASDLLGSLPKAIKRIKEGAWNSSPGNPLPASVP